jgi:hypothetical protein
MLSFTVEFMTPLRLEAKCHVSRIKPTNFSNDLWEYEGDGAVGLEPIGMIRA